MVLAYFFRTNVYQQNAYFMGSYNSLPISRAVVLKTDLDLQIQIMHAYALSPHEASYILSDDGSSIYFSELNNNRIYEVSTSDLTFARYIEITG